MVEYHNQSDKAEAFINISESFGYWFVYFEVYLHLVSFDYGFTVSSEICHVAKMAYGTVDEDDFFSQIRFEYTLMAE